MTDHFVHLNIHSDYSIVDGVVNVKGLVNKVDEYDMPAVALTDQSNIFATVKLYSACLSAGIKPILGADLWCQHELDEEPYRLIILCQNNEGYLNLKTLISRSYSLGQKAIKSSGKIDTKPIIDASWLKQFSSGLIILIGKESLFGRFLVQEKEQLAEEFITDLVKIYGNENCYIEVQRTNRNGDEKFLHESVKWANKLNLPLVGTNAVRFLKHDDFDKHETRVCISQGWVLGDKKRPQEFSDQQFFKSADEMKELFSDLPEAIENTIEIAKRCNVEIELGNNYLPEFPIPEGLTMDDYFRQLSHDGLAKRLEFLLDKSSDTYEQDKKTYIERLDTELDVIIQMGFPGYFLIVADFIQWSKENDVPVGPGRGSGAGSLVAYALTITDLDPLEYDLLFERFLNPERVSMPDFDIDFCMEGRDKVIAYVAETYGKDRVSQIITYGSMAAKASIRDVGRVQSLGYGMVDSVAKLIPMDIGMTISKAMEQEAELQQRYNDEEAVKDLVDMALALEGTVRNVGKHAGGVVISPSDINNFAPIYCEPDGSNIVTQFDKNDVESVGLVKFDFLGLKTLTVIDWAVQMINQQKKELNQELVDIISIDLEDRQAFDTLKASDTTAVFQLESRGMKELIAKLQPDCFEDIVALVALYRPGPLQSGMVDDFIERKHGRQKVEYPHPSLEPILKPTYGTILYQEQVMQISQVLAGYSLGGADLLRRAMGKKKLEEMAKQRSFFEDGAVNNEVDKELATHIFDQMEKFAAYGFNKSHSAAYALVSYQTLWLKTYYRSPFMAAVLSADMDNTAKVVGVIEECREVNIVVNVPDVNVSCYRFTVTMDQEIVYGLGAIKGVGEAAIINIEEVRQSKAYQDFQDFCNRVDLRKVNKRVIETLVKSGAMDKLGVNRATMLNAIPEAMRVAEQCKAADSAGQGDLFGDDLFSMDDNKSSDINLFETLAEWPKEEKLALEKATLGLYLSEHPIDEYLPELSQIITHKIKDLDPEKKQHIVICGLLLSVRVIPTKTGKKMAILLLDDRSGTQEVPLFADQYDKFQEQLVLDTILIIKGEISFNQYTGRERIGVDELFLLDGARNRFARFLLLELNQKQITDEFLSDFENLLKSNQPIQEENSSACDIVVNYQNENAQCRLLIDKRWSVNISQQLLQDFLSKDIKSTIVYSV
ncbi:MAG: DNA polymerase III subunit alpha [Gammaproteobacteria bacterium]|nr:DNA polymerase III subunit alpha [Gammaproteobacteria bacterium]